MSPAGIADRPDVCRSIEELERERLFAVPRPAPTAVGNATDAAIECKRKRIARFSSNIRLRTMACNAPASETAPIVARAPRRLAGEIVLGTSVVAPPGMGGHFLKADAPE